MTRSDHPTCGVRFVELRRFFAGELAAENRARIEQHLGSCEHCRARTGELERERNTFAAQIDVSVESSRAVERLERPDETPRWRRARAWFLDSRALPIRAAMLLFLVVSFAVTILRQDKYTGLKGSAGIEMYVKDASGIRPALDGARLREGDAIQFRYRAAGKRYVFIVSVTGDGTISPLYPDEAGQSIPVEPSGTHVLEGSVILDEARGPERIFAFFSDTPLELHEVQAAVSEELGRLERDVTRLQEVQMEREDVDEASVLIIKE